MRSIGIAAAILAATIALSGCKDRKEEPIPGPRASRATAEVPLSQSPTAPGGRSTTPAHPIEGQRRHGASGIAWFQGGLEEAFSCPNCTAAIFWRDTVGR
jgi:hypothetical protein